MSNDWFSIDKTKIEQRIRAWAATPLLERAKGTKLSKLRDVLSSQDAVAVDLGAGLEWADLVKEGIVRGMFPHIFVVEHDWAGAFSTADDVDLDQGLSGVKLPYPASVFEFQINGLRVCAAITQAEGDDIRPALCFVETPIGWCALALHNSWLAGTKTLIEKQVRAVCIALDAKVAETEIVRVPEKLNRARERRGKLRFFDHHVVKLSKRSRPASLPDDGPEKARRGVRLHFRRGHWRHYESHKTWINWMLVGDPDLGFIEKHYRL